MSGIMLNVVGATTVAAAAVTASTTSFSNVSWNWEQYNNYQLAYAGLDSSSRPVFAYGYREVTTDDAMFCLFRVNSDLTITQGSTNNIFTGTCSSGVAATVDTDNNYGYLIYQKGGANGAFAKTFTIDKDALSIGTPGTELTVYASSDASMVSADYAGSGRVHYFHRRGGQVSGNFYSTRSGTTLTLGTEIVGNIAASTVYTQLRTFTASGTLYRHAIISGNGAPQLNAMYWNNTTGSTVSTATAFSWGATSILHHELVRLKAADKFMIVTNVTAGMRAAAGTITWPSSGTTAPTIAVGAILSLTDATSSNMYGAIDGFANDEAYIVYKKSSDSKFYYRKITASTNTLTEGAATEISILSASAANQLICKGVTAFSKNYIVGIADNTGSASPDIFVTEVA